jgi:hypothetical protein
LALNRLKDASIIVYRKFRSAYQIWEGSDLNIDDLLRSAQDQLDPQQEVIARLQKAVNPQPIMAQRHFYATGTMRYFSVNFCDERQNIKDFDYISSDADGALFIALPSDASTKAELEGRLPSLKDHLTLNQDITKPSVVGLPANYLTVRNLAMELTAMEWVRRNTPQLQSDAVARRELEGRIAAVEQQLRSQMKRIFSGAEDCIWFDSKGSWKASAPRSLQKRLSANFDRAYNQAPIIKNELINRRIISSAAAGARKSLMQAMIGQSKEPQLGIEGHPPELGLYYAILRDGGWHLKKGQSYGFCEPQKGASAHVYQRVIKSLEGAQDKPITLQKVYDELTHAPYGLRDGVIPILTFAVLLQHEHSIALYEDGSFVPQLDDTFIERMLRRPEKISVQKIAVTGGRGVFLKAFGITSNSPITLAKELVRIVGKMSDYGRNTQDLTTEARKLREVVLRARNPNKLVFADVPTACGFDVLGGKEYPKDQLEGLVDVFRRSCTHLTNCDQKLLSRIERALQDCFRLSSDFAQMRQDLINMSQEVAKIAVDEEVKSFCVRATDQGLEREQWLVAMGTALVGKPPHSWHDRDTQHMLQAMRRIAGRFIGLRSLALADAQHNDHAYEALLRVAVTQVGSAETETVVAIGQEDAHDFHATRKHLNTTIETLMQSGMRDDVLIAALSSVIRDRLQDDTDSGEVATEEYES